MKCPKCGLENVPTAEYCDCGYSFKGGDIDTSRMQGDYARVVSEWYFVFCWVMVVLGGILGLILSGAVAFGRYSPVYKSRARVIFLVGLLWIPVLILIRYALSRR